MKILKAKRFIEKCWQDVNAKYDFNKKLDHRFIQVGSVFYECKELGTSLGESLGGDSYWVAIRRALKQEVMEYATQSCWVNCSDECRDFVIFPNRH